MLNYLKPIELISNMYVFSVSSIFFAFFFWFFFSILFFSTHSTFLACIPVSFAITLIWWMKMLKHVQISPHRNRSDSVSLRSSISSSSSLCGSPEPHDSLRPSSRASSYCSLNETMPQVNSKYKYLFAIVFFTDQCYTNLAKYTELSNLISNSSTFRNHISSWCVFHVRFYFQQKKIAA